MDNRIKLRVMGISYTPMQSGAFALLLAVDGDSPVRIPIVIGAPEAQSIALGLERVKTPRPMTHDLFCTFAQAFGVQLKEVFIYRFEDGVFSSEMTFTDGTRTIVLDARTSDAIAVAMRCGAPIYTTPDIVSETGIELEEVGHIADHDADSADHADDTPAAESLDAMTDQQLQERLNMLIQQDDFEEAARVSAILKTRRGEDSN